MFDRWCRGTREVCIVLVVGFGALFYPGRVCALEVAEGWAAALYAELPRDCDGTPVDALPEPQEIDLDAEGALYVGVGQAWNRIYRVPPTATADLPAQPEAVISSVKQPAGIAVDAGDGLWYTDYHGCVRRRDPSGDTICYDVSSGGAELTTLSIDVDGHFGPATGVYTASLCHWIMQVDPTAPRDEAVDRVFHLPLIARVIDFGTDPWLWLGGEDGVYTMSPTTDGYEVRAYDVPGEIKACHVSALRFDRDSGSLWLGIGGDEQKIYRVAVEAGTVELVGWDCVARGFAFGADGRVYLSSRDDGSLYVLSSGEEEETPFRRGDANNDGRVNISDPIAVTRHIFLDHVQLSCPDSADINDDGRVLPDDVIVLLKWLFQSGAPPAEPLEACGFDPTDDALTCEAYDHCP